MSRFLNTSTNMLNIAINPKSTGSGLIPQLYSTNDEIVGEVSITASSDIHVEDLDISFIGSTQTRFDNFGAAPIAPGVTCTEKRFLRLRQPFSKSPRGTVLRAAAHPYSFPFTFTIPHRLLPSTCSCPNQHTSSSDHLLPPPTMGGRHRWETPTGAALDDPTPVMAQVSYTIEAKLVYSKQRDNRRRRIVANASRGVCVVPSFPESPPIFLHAPPSYSSSSSPEEEEEETQYRLRHEKTIGGGGGLLSRGKAGCLVVQVPQQPGALKGGLSSSSSSSSPASVTLLLRFDPAASSSASPPPRLEDVKRSLRATTVFRAGVEEGPEYGKLVGGGGGGGEQQQRRSYSEAVPLPSLRVSGARWRRCEPGWAQEGLLEGGRRPEEEEVVMVAPSSRYAGGVYYLMRLQIPVEYPAGKALVPTFRSCLVERSYRLDVAVTLSAFSSVAVRVPLQLCT